MGQLSQLVLLASVVVSCISYSDSSRNMPVREPPAEPSESDFSDYPTKFMNKLLASLSPEELRELQRPIILGELSHRNGIEGGRPCRKRQVTRNFPEVKVKDVKYYVVPHQPVTYFACDERKSNKGVYNNKCGPVKNRNGLHAAYCCVQDKKTIPLYVLPEPTSKFDICNETLCLKGTNIEYVVYEKIKKEVYVNSDCICEEYKPKSPVTDDNYSCPRPDSSVRNILRFYKF